ncbi:MAG: bifunctional hydroxymethylpyrimidine kinase/phosphomethylpyrimidine kinase [Actinobacteria bacterium]|nr:bifunctional hydroxymethylpyrimidine kinase/phosphomethylpyrimidine kinase [Actinomycetota bacterium]
MSARIAIFGPHPLLTVSLEREGDDERERVHFHAGGQGVWVARQAGELGAAPVLCGFVGGEAGALLRPLLERLPGERRLVETTTESGCYVVDRRRGSRDALAFTTSEPPSRHELDALFSLTCAEALACGWLIVANPMPAEALPLTIYGDLVADARANGCKTLVDLSSPRLDSALAGRPDLVKINDWELAAYVRGPVSEPRELRAAAERVRDAGAGSVIVTRGEQPALVLHEERAWLLVPPRFERGWREGCGDAMMGALAAAWAQGAAFEDAIVTGAAAGAGTFLRQGLGSAARDVVEELRAAVRVEPFAA